jgi:hypothetical protein
VEVMVVEKMNPSSETAAAAVRVVAAVGAV